MRYKIEGRLFCRRRTIELNRGENFHAVRRNVLDERRH